MRGRSFSHGYRCENLLEVRLSCIITAVDWLPREEIYAVDPTEVT